MNAPHVHLMLNHLPVVGVLLGFLAYVAALLGRNREWQRLALGLLVVTAALAVPAYISGTWAEEGVERLPGVTEGFIERHEEAAVAGLTASIALGLVALWALAAGRGERRRPAWLAILVLVVGGITVGLLGRAAGLGGEIRHTEIRAGAGTVGAEGGEAPRR
jgi:uncharacterized membrane protein